MHYKLGYFWSDQCIFVSPQTFDRYSGFIEWQWVLRESHLLFFVLSCAGLWVTFHRPNGHCHVPPSALIYLSPAHEAQTLTSSLLGKQEYQGWENMSCGVSFLLSEFWAAAWFSVVFFSMYTMKVMASMCQNCFENYREDAPVKETNELPHLFNRYLLCTYYMPDYAMHLFLCVFWQRLELKSIRGILKCILWAHFTDKGSWYKIWRSQRS